MLPAIDLVLLETGSNHRVEIFSTVLGLHPHTQIIFSSPPDTYPGVEAVPRTGEFNDGRDCPDLLYRHIKFVQKLVKVFVERAENVAFNAREVKFQLKYDSGYTRHRADLCFSVDATVRKKIVP